MGDVEIKEEDAKLNLGVKGKIICDDEKDVIKYDKVEINLKTEPDTGLFEPDTPSDEGNFEFDDA